LNPHYNKPIGVIDSGVGGLTVWRELIKMLPNENSIYFADSQNCPYGSKPLETIRELTFNIVKFLLTQDCKLILIACNSISASIINELRKFYPDVPFVGIEPAIKVAASHTKTKNIGVLATEATVKGELYNHTKTVIPDDINIHVQIGYNLVDLIELGKINSTETSETLEKYISTLINKNVDEVVLGCTHYPFLIDQMKKVSGDKINYIDPASAVVKQVERMLIKHEIKNGSDKIGNHKLYSSGSFFPAKELLPEFDISSIEIIKEYKL